jgi:hypothetical protein
MYTVLHALRPENKGKAIKYSWKTRDLAVCRKQRKDFRQRKIFLLGDPDEKREGNRENGESPEKPTIDPGRKQSDGRLRETDDGSSRAV